MKHRVYWYIYFHDELQSENV